MAENAARLSDQLCFALYAASSKLTAIYRPILAPLDLTYPQFVTMMALWQDDKISVTELAGKTSLSKATMSPLLKKLEQKQLITLQRAGNSDRRKEVALSEKGRALAAQSLKATEQAFCATGLPLAQAQLIIELCAKIGEPQ